MKKKLAVFFILITILFSFHTWNNSNKEVVEIKKSIYSTTYLSKKEEEKATLASDKSNWICPKKSEKQEILEKKPIGIALSNIIAIKSQIFSDPGKFFLDIHRIKDSNKRDQAELAFFEYASICFSVLNNDNGESDRFKKYKCDLAPIEVIKNPIVILEKAASGGSNLAKFYYLYAYINNHMAYETSIFPETREFAKIAKEKARIYGEEASKSGMKEASILMSRVYREGTFGENDNAKSYSYLIKAQSNNDISLKKYMTYLEKNMSKEEISDAKNYAEGCVSSKSMINPF